EMIQRWPQKRNVLCIDIPGEPGSGLTTLLKQISFSLADRGSLVLFHSGPVTKLNLDRVRSFCDALVELAADARDPAVVLVFDAPSVLDDATLTLNGFAPRWMERTDTRLFLLRGIPISPGRATEKNAVASVETNPRFKVPSAKKREHVERQVLEP